MVPTRLWPVHQPGLLRHPSTAQIFLSRCPFLNYRSSWGTCLDLDHSAVGLVRLDAARRSRRRGRLHLRLEFLQGLSDTKNALSMLHDSVLLITLCKYEVTCRSVLSLWYCGAQAPEKVEIKLEAPTEVPPAPKPKLTCNATTVVECDGQPCCNWCGTVWNATSPGFCMPVMDEPIPSMMCSKQGKSCGDMITADMCAQDVICTWIPFGPPGTAGPGICTFDWAKC
jgi:hypothetical protein